MQSEGKIKKKLKDAKFRYMKRELRDKLKKCPENCQYNERHTFTTYSYVEGQEKPVPHVHEVGLCMYGAANPEEWQGKICDDVETAQECPLFLGKFDKEDIKAAFEEKLEDPVVLAEQYKDLAALQWVLDTNIVEEPLRAHQRMWLFLTYYLYLFSESVRRSGIL